MVTYVHSYRHTYMQTVGPETSFKPGLGAMEIACNAMEIAAKQTLCEEASLELACRPRGRPGDRP